MNPFYISDSVRHNNTSLEQLSISYKPCNIIWVYVKFHMNLDKCYIAICNPSDNVKFNNVITGFQVVQNTSCILRGKSLTGCKSLDF